MMSVALLAWVSAETLTGDGVECVDGELTTTGSTYRGDLSETFSGIGCQSWDSQTPHPHTRTPEK